MAGGMKVLVVGSGGREHALCWAIARSPRLDTLWCAPGNAGIADVAACVDIAADDEIRPLLMGKTLEHLRLALRLNLEQAQWAALNGRPEVYRAALGDARQLLEKYFGLDLADNQALHARLGELEKLPVEQKVPDLAPALNALQAYLAQRAHADVQALEARQKAEVPKAAAEGAVQ